MSGRHQQGYIWKKGRAWYGRWYEDVNVDNRVERRARARKLAPYNDRYRSVRDVRPLLDAILVPLNEGHTNPHGTMTVAQYFAKFFMPYIEAELKPSTVNGYKHYWRMYLQPRLGSAVLRDYRCVDATNLLADIYAERGIGRLSLRHCKALLRSIFTHAKRSGVIDGVNPITDAGVPRKAPKSKQTQAATADEVAVMLDILDGTARVAVALMYFCGLRPSEARGLQWQDFDGQQLHVKQSVWRVYVDTPKTEDSAAAIPVCEPLRSMLNELRQPSGYILAGPSGKPINLANLARRQIRPALHEKGVKWRGWYSFRRGIATLATSVESPLAAKGLLRHGDLSTTTKHYVKDVPEETQRAMKKIEVLFRTEQKPPVQR